MKLHSIAIAAAMMAGMAFTAQADEREVEFTYLTPESEYKDWGTKKLENYDVAIHLTDPGLAGTKVFGFTCPIAAVENISGLTGWASAIVNLNEDEVNVPDVVGTATLDTENKIITVTFETPYEITRDGAYIGFSFKMDELTDDTKQPLVLASGTDLEGFWIHTSRTYRKWTTLEWRKLVVPMTVQMGGDFADNCVAISSFEGKSVQADTPFEITINITNFGSEEVKTLDYEYEVAGQSFGGTVELETPVAAQFGARGTATLKFEGVEDWGDHELKLTLTTVNGKLNESVNASATALLKVIGFVPVNRPLMEEYTGLWCGFCPRGYIALERIAHNPEWNDKYVTLSLHGSGRDPMQVVATFPQNPGGFPAAMLNRLYNVDPYHGSTQSKPMGILEDMDALAAQPADADISVTCDWKDDSHRELVCRSVVRFPNEHSGAKYRVAYAVLADGLTEIDGTAFVQSNYFADDKTISDGNPDWDVFVKGGEKVGGLTFNDILVAFDNVWGIYGSVPSEIEYGKEYVHHYTYYPPFKNIFDQEVVKDYSKIRVVAMLINNGVVVNAAKSGYVGTSGIREIAADSDSDAEVVESEYFDIEGRRIMNPAQGKLYIRVDRLSDGTTRPVKVIR